MRPKHMLKLIDKQIITILHNHIVVLKCPLTVHKENILSTTTTGI